ncbi:MAG: LamG domain-containing protein, partial [Pseudomonadota bacterium]
MELKLNDTFLGVDPISLSGDFTITAWARLDGEIANSQSLGGSASQNLNFHNGLFRMFVGAPERDVVVAASETTAGEWTHYAIVREGNEMRLYMNGELDAVATTTWTGNYVYDTIGGAGPHGATLNGAIDEIGLYSTSFDATGIADIINTGVASVTTERVAYYDFDSAAGTPTLGTGATLTDTRAPVVERVLDLDGASNNIDPLTLTGDFTISARVKLDDAATNADAILGSGTDVYSGQNLNFAGGNLRLFAGRNDGRDIVTAQTDIEIGEWTHYSVVRSGDQ